MITAEDMIRVVCELAVRVERLETLLMEFYGATQEWSEFQVLETLKIKLDIHEYSKKTPFRRLEELEQSLKGFITYYYENQKKDTPKRKKGHSLVIPPYTPL